MKTKGRTHECISLLFQWTGVTDQLIVDGYKEKVLGLFQKNCSEVGYCLKQT